MLSCCVVLLCRVSTSAEIMWRLRLRGPCALAEGTIGMHQTIIFGSDDADPVGGSSGNLAMVANMRSMRSRRLLNV